MLSEIITRDAVVKYPHDELRDFTMKHLPIYMTLLVLSACSRAPETIEEIKKTIEGRWVLNPGYCENQIAESGFADILIKDGGIKTNQVLAEGKWFSPNNEAELLTIISAFIEAKKIDCKSDIGDGSPLLINFESYEQNFTLAYFPDNDLLFRISETGVVVATRYDATYLQELQTIN